MSDFINKTYNGNTADNYLLPLYRKNVKKTPGDNLISR